MTADLATPVNAAAASLAGKYLTFTLQAESYGIDVLKVREIIRHITITAVPQMPDYIRGVINLRGKIIPVMDLRVRFGFPNVTNTDQTCIVVVQVKLPDGKSTPMGLVVDGVEEVLNFNAADIEQTVTNTPDVHLVCSEIPPITPWGWWWTASRKCSISTPPTSSRRRILAGRSPWTTSSAWPRSKAW